MDDCRTFAPSIHQPGSDHGSLYSGGDDLLEEYENGMVRVREEFARHPAVMSLFELPMEPVAMEAFLISFATLGVKMTEPVEGWIRGAGRRCGELGLVQLGKALESHAKQEADHHLLMLADATHLVAGWNGKREPRLAVSTLLEVPPPPGVVAYRRLHEDVISGPTPYGQLGIEYEIEMLSVTYGPRLIERAIDLLGETVLENLSFLRDHVSLDVGHTKFNRAQLSRLLKENPDFLPGLIAAASAALRAYAVFLDDCIHFVRVAVAL